MIPRPECQRFDTSHPQLCSGLRWKGLFIDAERDITVPPCNDGLFWCMYTQTCIGPDGLLAEPGNCNDTARKCHGTGKCS